jgi:NAD(P)H-nitrite reductase large subunit
MQKFDYLIVGGGVAGTTAAETIRKNDQKGTIAIISEEPEPLYSRLTLHHYLKDLIPLERLYLRNEDSYKEKRIDFFKGKKAQELDVSKKEIKLSDGQVLGFGKLLIATGGYPNVWQVSGAEKKGVFYLRTLEDAKNIRARIEETKGSNPNAIVVGGGFVGLDLLTSFAKQNLATTVLVIEDYFWQGKVDEESGKLIEDILKKNNIKVQVAEETEEVLGNKEVEAVKTKSGKILKAGIVGVGIGIYFDLDWLRTAGVSTNWGILTNEYLETNVPGIFAAGDICQFWDVLFKRQHLMGNWVNAQEQGKVAGFNMTHSGLSGQAGEKIVFQTVSAYSVNFFDDQVSFIGVTDVKEATSTITRGSRKEGSIGTLFLKDVRLIGATLVNRAREQRAITQLIKNKVDLKDYLDKLSDPNFDLYTLI